MSSSTPQKTPSAPTPTSTSVKRACDACHRRKVKCDGLNPCRNCSSAQLACTYHAIPQKKGPKGSRAKVISELRETQRQSTLSNKNRFNGMHNPAVPPTLAPTPGLLTNEMIHDCIEFFFNNMYPTVPILHRQRLEAQARHVHIDIDTYCLLSSLCAFMMIQPGMPMPGGPMGQSSMFGANITTGMLLMEETIRVRKGYDYLESPTVGSLCTSYFLFACHYGLDLHNKAWFHLREATTLAHILNMNKEETYMQWDMIESSRRRRLYWLLFVAERAYALQRHRPLSLDATISLPTAGDDPTECAPPLAGFIHLVNVYKPFDNAFLGLWNKTRNDCSPGYLGSLQKQLTDALPVYLGSTEAQQAELQVNQQWLKTIVWQLSIQNGCLSSSHDDPSMTFSYPVDISRDLITMTSGFSQQSMEVHGVAIIEKLFDVACSLTDVLSLLPTPSDPFVTGPRDYLNQFLSLLSTLRNGDHRFMPLLMQKVHEVLPRLVNPMLQTVPETPATQIAANIDIFDGFGNAGMSVPAQQQQYQKYENDKYDSGRMQEIPEVANKNNNQNHDNGHGSHNSDSPYSQENTPFTSPPMMTGGMDNQLGFQSINSYAYLNTDSMPLQNSMQPPRPTLAMRAQTGSYHNQPSNALMPSLQRSMSVQDFGHEEFGQSSLPPGQMPLPIGGGIDTSNLDHLAYR